MRHLRPLLRPGLAAVAVAAVLGAAGCASTNDDAARAALDAVRAPGTTVPATATTSATTAPAPDCDPTASLRPQGALPVPGQMPAGSYMRTIQDRGRLVVGVDQNTLLFGYRNPKTGALEGYDIDVAREIARAIFGDPDRIEFKVVTTAERLPAVEQGKVDLVASLVTMTCARWQEASFSSEYYAAGQGLMVRADSPITSVADLAGKRVCATRGSTSASRLRQVAPDATLEEATTRTECLVALQNGRVDAITADDTILYGFRAQDPRTTRILDQRLSEEPYGLAIAQEHPEFVRFANGVLERMRTDGTLDRIDGSWLSSLRPTPEPPAADYRD